MPDGAVATLRDRPRLAFLGVGWIGRHRMEAVLASGIAYEFRTTMHPSLLSEEEILDIARTLSDMGVKNYALQAFRAQGCRTKELKATAGTPAESAAETIQPEQRLGP